MALAWAEALGDVRVDDALTAVTRHYAASTDWLMPAHIAKLAKVIRKEREAEEAWQRSEAQGLPPGEPEHLGPPGEAAAALLAELRTRLPEGVALRRWPRLVPQDEPNPHYQGPPPPGGWPQPDTTEESPR